MCAFILSFVTYFHDQSGQYSVIGRFSRYRRCRDIEFVRSRVFLYLNGIFYGFACGLYASECGFRCCGQRILGRNIGFVIEVVVVVAGCYGSEFWNLGIVWKTACRRTAADGLFPDTDSVVKNFRNVKSDIIRYNLYGIFVSLWKPKTRSEERRVGKECRL